MDKHYVLNYAPALTTMPFQNGTLTTAIDQIEQNGEIFFRVVYNTDDECGCFDLFVTNKEGYKNGQNAVWGMWDKGLTELHKTKIDFIGKDIELSFKDLI